MLNNKTAIDLFSKGITLAINIIVACSKIKIK